MIPILSIIGKFNVGKSNFFNNIIHFKDNLSYNFKHLTLNNKFFFNIIHNYNYIIIDSVGFNFFLNFKLNINYLVFESDLLLFFIDNSYGIFYEDKILSIFIKKKKKYIFLIINKIDNLNLNINIFNFFKLGFKKPYLLSCTNDFNSFYLINSVLVNFCFLKKCFHLKKKINKLKVIIIYNDSRLNNFINFFFNKKKIKNLFKNFFNVDLFIFFKKINFIFININLYKNFNFCEKIKKIYFLKILKNIIISDIIIFIIDPLFLFKDIFFLKFILKNFKYLIFLINRLNFLNVLERIYFKNFFIKKFSLYFFYVLFFSICCKINYFYLSYYINKISNFFYLDFKFNKNFNKFIINFNNFLNLNYNNLKVNIKWVHQGGKNPPLIIIHGENLINLKLFNLLKYFRYNFIRFFKLKSVFLKIILL
ncbi:GTPase [Candidatus Nasuia deltocephalinicola]|uniref:GTPase n=1 Tax=Candidatus Nasuia deltocephalincola TaxID=1160784 RepID=UPI00216ADDA5|nr:GTPase [Candidatus Nasuia deltocephalinicola]